MGSGPVKGFSVTLAVGISPHYFQYILLQRMLTAFYVIKIKRERI